MMIIDDLKATADTYYESNWLFSEVLTWRKIVELNPSTFNLHQYADRLRLSGKYDEALGILKNLKIKDIPADYRFVYHIGLGMIYKDQNRSKKAIKEFKKSIKIGTNETYPYIFLAIELIHQNELEEAEKILIEALNKEGNIDEVYFNLSTLHARKQNFQEAINMIENCMKIDENYPCAKAFLEDYKNALQILRG